MKNQPHPKHLFLLQNAYYQVIKLEANENYTKFFLENGTTKMMSYSLKNYQNHFNHPFIRVNKSCIVNLSYYLNICSENKTIQLKDGSKIKVSRRRMEEVLKNISIHN
jgi:DNA-binding LytR/AlgR family response regulator